MLPTWQYDVVPKKHEHTFQMTLNNRGRHKAKLVQGANSVHAILANLITIGPTVFSEGEGTLNWSSEVP